MPQVMGILPVSSADSRLLNTRNKPRLARLPEPSTALTPRQFAPPDAFPVHGSYRPNRSTGLPTHYTSYPGLEYDPGLSPDGNHVVFTWNRGDGFDLYLKPVASDER